MADRYLCNFLQFGDAEFSKKFCIFFQKGLAKNSFSYISAEAKLMYGLLLDRNSLSQKNGWMDEENRVYIIYTIEEMKKDLNCATEKISKVLKELENIGLIYRKRNGRGKANYIYVMDYMTIYRRKQTAEKGTDSAVMNFDNRKSSILNSENLEFRKSKGNKTNKNNTDYSNLANRKRYKNSFCNFQQREYNFEELEQMLLANQLSADKKT